MESLFVMCMIIDGEGSGRGGSSQHEVVRDTGDERRADPECGPELGHDEEAVVAAQYHARALFVGRVGRPPEDGVDAGEPSADLLVGGSSQNPNSAVPGATARAAGSTRGDRRTDARRFTLPTRAPASASGTSSGGGRRPAAASA